MTEEERGEYAFALHTKIVENEKLRRELIAQNAKYLNEIQTKELYKELLGDGVEGEWAGYLADITIYYARSKVFSLTTCYKRLTQKLGIDEEIWAHIPLTRLMDMLPIITSENWEVWFQKALVLTSKDWQIELRAAKGLPTEETEHDHKMDTYNICRVCGKKEKDHSHEAEQSQPDIIYTQENDSEDFIERVVR